ncbi:SDR family oxidoreductase [Halobium salinum]
MTTVFLTGFPGFLGSALLGRLLDRYDDEVELACLVQSKYRDDAEDRARSIAGDDWDERIALYEGDITEGDLGLDPDEYADLELDTVEVYHLAAVYDVGVSEAVGKRVNVDGTRHVLHFAENCPDLRRFQYVSTCYVSGRYDGLFTESMLEEAGPFHNHYESSKHEAEVLVREAMDEGLPATVYRPAITVGDSETGETQKYDGPYYVLQLLLRQGDYALTPAMLGSSGVEVNVVPRDFVVDAIDELSAMERSEGVTYQLADPAPATASKLLRLFADAADTTPVPVPMTRGLAKGAFHRVPELRERVAVEPATLDYFTHPTRYTCANTVRDLRGTDVECPPIETYAATLVEFMRANPDIDPDAMT